MRRLIVMTFAALLMLGGIASAQTATPTDTPTDTPTPTASPTATWTPLPGGPIAHGTSAVSCPTTAGFATAIPDSTPAPGETSGVPNRFCAIFQDQDSTNAVLLIDCAVKATIAKLYALGPPATICGTNAVCCRGVGGTVSLSIGETTRK